MCVSNVAHLNKVCNVYLPFQLLCVTLMYRNFASIWVWICFWFSIACICKILKFKVYFFLQIKINAFHLNENDAYLRYNVLLSLLWSTCDARLSTHVLLTLVHCVFCNSGLVESQRMGFRVRFPCCVTGGHARVRPRRCVILRTSHSVLS